VVNPRSGIALAEVLVALALLSTGALALAAGAHRAGRAAGALRDREAAQVAGAWILDSLTVSPAPASGEREAGPLLVRWTVAGTALRVRVLDRRGRVVSLLAGRRAVRLAPRPGAP
jgi:Tfp pilus assembly protein PilV